MRDNKSKIWRLEDYNTITLRTAKKYKTNTHYLHLIRHFPAGFASTFNSPYLHDIVNFTDSIPSPQETESKI